MQIKTPSAKGLVIPRSGCKSWVEKMDGANDGLRTTADDLPSREARSPIRYTRLWVGLGR
jgi:hypothetical protein